MLILHTFTQPNDHRKKWDLRAKLSLHLMPDELAAFAALIEDRIIDFVNSLDIAALKPSKTQSLFERSRGSSATPMPLITFKFSYHYTSARRLVVLKTDIERL